MLTLQLFVLFNYTNATPSSRNMIEGQNVINSGMIIMCGATTKTSEKIELYSLCLQTSALTSEPHLITGSLLISNVYDDEVSDVQLEVTIEKMNCTCKAGTSHSCKHVVAVLLYCNRNDINGLELVSSTDQKCLWQRHKQPVLEQFQALPTKTFCCVLQERLPTLSENQLSVIRNKLIECDSESAIAKHRNRIVKPQRVPFQEIQNQLPAVARQNTCANSQSAVTDASQTPKDFNHSIVSNAKKSKLIQQLCNTSLTLPDCCQGLYNSLIACKDILETAIRTKSSISEWKKERKYRITGSRCYNLYTYSKEKDSWPEKARKYFWAKEVKNKYTDHGNKYESVARELYAREKQVYVAECGLIVADGEHWLAYSADGVIMQDDKAQKLLEIKCPFDLKDTRLETLMTECNFLQKNSNPLSLKKRHQYYGQIQFGMALLNLTKCDFVIYSSKSDSIHIINVDFDEKFVKDMLINLKEKFFEKMLHQVCCLSRVGQEKC